MKPRYTLLSLKAGLFCTAIEGLPGTHAADQSVIELRGLPASASQVLRLKACTITTWYCQIFLDPGYLPEVCFLGQRGQEAGTVKENPQHLT